MYCVGGPQSFQNLALRAASSGFRREFPNLGRMPEAFHWYGDVQPSTHRGRIYIGPALQMKRKERPHHRGRRSMLLGMILISLGIMLCATCPVCVPSPSNKVADGFLAVPRDLSWQGRPDDTCATKMVCATRPVCVPSPGNKVADGFLAAPRDLSWLGRPDDTCTTKKGDGPSTAGGRSAWSCRTCIVVHARTCVAS